MPTDSLDRDFLRFSRTRDPDALAAVFDAAAPRLLLVAMHLCGDAAAAEDLVQTVFLQALRDVDRFDARRPVLPWLMTILEHRASDHRGRAHRRRERGGHGAASDEVPGRAASPEGQAIAAEVRQRLAEALAGMPGDYRDVLTLRLVHGLSTVDIAHAHGVPPATVRTRLRRGLELLRNALPRGLATPGLLALLGAELLRARDGLTVVRAHVLAAAAGGTGVTFGIGFWGLLAAGVLLVFGGLQWWLQSEPAVPVVDGTAERVVAEMAEEPQPASRPAPLAPSGERTLADLAAPSRAATLSGRVVDSVTGRPVTDASVHVRAYLDEWRGDAPVDWRDPDAVQVGVDGRFEIAFVPTATMRIEVGFAAMAHVKQWRTFEPLREGVAIDLGDVAMQPGTPVRVRLLVGDEPLDGVECFASFTADGAEPNSKEGFGPSDRDGYLDLGVCTPGTWYYELETAYLGHTGRFMVPLQTARFEATITLQEPPPERSISGVLVDTQGVPVAGVELAIRADAGGVYTATTRLDGRFLWSLAQLPAEPKPRIELWGNRPELELAHDGGEVAWGSHDLRLVVRRRVPASLRLEVVDAATGRAVEAFGAHCWRDPWGPRFMGRPDFKRAPIVAHADGVASFTDLAPGAWFVSVFPPAPWAEHAEMPVVLAEGAKPTLRVELMRPVSLAVTVTDANTGAPLPDIEVALAKVVPAERRAQVAIGDFRMELAKARAGRGYSSAHNTLVLARATSDAAGLATLQAPPDLPGLVLFAEGPHCIATLRHDVELPRQGGTTTIAVVPAAQVRGVLGPRAFLDRCGPTPAALAAAATNARTQWPAPDAFAEDWPRVELRAVGERKARFAKYVDANGAFAIGGLPPGRYEAWVVAEVRDDGGDLAWGTDLGPLATVTVEAGEPAPALQLDASQFLPARATLQFFVDGAPWHGDVGVVMPGDGLRVELETDANGAVVTPWLRPGPYVPFVRGVDARGERYVIAGGERFVVAPGRDVTATCMLQRRRVEITVVDSAGKPRPDRWLRVESLDAPEVQYQPPQATDADGRLVLDPAAPGRLRVRAFAASWRRGSEDEPVHELGDVGALADRATFVLRQ